MALPGDGASVDAASWNRPAKARSGRSALVISPGFASHTDRMAFSAGIPVIVMPTEAKYSGVQAPCGIPVAGKIMWRLTIVGSPSMVVM